MKYREHLNLIKVEEVNGHEVVKLRKRTNIYIYLCASIMSQQLSTKVARLFMIVSEFA
jgi:hypothetical protein